MVLLIAALERMSAGEWISAIRYRGFESPRPTPGAPPARARRRWRRGRPRGRSSLDDPQADAGEAEQPEDDEEPADQPERGINSQGRGRQDPFSDIIPIAAKGIPHHRRHAIERE